MIRSETEQKGNFIRLVRGQCVTGHLNSFFPSNLCLDFAPPLSPVYRVLDTVRVIKALQCGLTSGASLTHTDGMIWVSFDF